MRRTVRAGLGAGLVVWLLAPLAALAQAPGEPSAVIQRDCDRTCLIGLVRLYMEALAVRDPSRVPFAKEVRFTENNVEMPLGDDGLWATVSAVAPQGLEAADELTGEAAWIGTVEERGEPAYYGMRLQVRGRRITEVETVVVRQTGLPLPFGDVSKVVHDPAFAQVLPPEQRRPRERLIAVADSYFDTVELNDGMVFAPFDADCGRLENGILTTSATSAGAAGAIVQGCEAQLELGLYRINKRIRERRYPIVDVERGVVVATGFFDHANEFDTYRTTDGVERKTLLKWPNSISLVEAFKIRDGRIHRIEAVFTYVPYFMHSPFYAYPAVPPPAPAVRTAAGGCDRTCLVGFAERYLEALVQRDPAALPWAERVRFTENSVPLMIGDGLWGSIRGRQPGGLFVADPATGEVGWYGIVAEHDAPAYFGMRLRISDGRIVEVETVLARNRNPGPFGDPARFAVDPGFAQALPEDARMPRARMIALAEGYANSVQLDDGKLYTRFDPACVRRENGVSATHGEGATSARGCEAQLRAGRHSPVSRVRDRRVLMVDEERGLVVMSSFADIDGRAPQTAAKYPSARELYEIYKVGDGQIRRIEAISVFQPYRMPSPWMGGP